MHYVDNCTRGGNASTGAMGAGNRTLSKIVSSYTLKRDQRVGGLRKGRDVEEIETRVAEKEKEAKQEAMIGRTAGVMTGVGSPARMGKETSPPPKRRSGDEDDSSQERRQLESRLEKLKEKKTRRLRKEIFNNEEAYIDLQRSWSGSSGRQNVKTVRVQQSYGSLGHRNDSMNKEGEDEHEEEVDDDR